MKEKTILLVEDDRNDEHLVRVALSRKGVMNELVVVRDGQAALDYLFGAGTFAGRDTAVQPALVLLDLGLPKVDGLTVLERIRADERTRLVPVVILSASGDESKLTAAYRLGANSYIRKLLDFNEFMEAVSQLHIYWISLNTPAPRQSKMLLVGTEEQIRSEQAAAKQPAGDKS